MAPHDPETAPTLAFTHQNLSHLLHPQILRPASNLPRPQGSLNQLPRRAICRAELFNSRRLACATCRLDRQMSNPSWFAAVHPEPKSSTDDTPWLKRRSVACGQCQGPLITLSLALITSQVTELMTIFWESETLCGRIWNVSCSMTPSQQETAT